MSLQGSPRASTPPTPFNIAGPNKTNLNTGIIKAIDPNEFVNTGGTLHFKVGPTIPVGGTINPVVLQANTAVPAALSANDLLTGIGGDGLVASMSLRSFGNNGQFISSRAEGTEALPTALLAGSTMFQFGALGNNGTGYVTGARLTFGSMENWTTLTSGAEARIITHGTNGGALSTKLKVGNVVVVGTAVANGTAGEIAGGGAFQVSGGALLDIINLGSAASVPQILAGAGAPPAGTVAVSSLYIRSNGSLGAGLYFANAGGTYTPVALV